jgi:hypothetical protein
MIPQETVGAREQDFSERVPPWRALGSRMPFELSLRTDQLTEALLRHSRIRDVATSRLILTISSLVLQVILLKVVAGAENKSPVDIQLA